MKAQILFLTSVLAFQLCNLACKKSEKQVDIINRQTEFTEEESAQIIQSVEFKNVAKIQNQLLDNVSTALKSGWTLEQLTDLSLKALGDKKEQEIYKVLFGSSTASNDYFSNLQSARKRFLEKNPKILNNAELFTCEPCKKSLEGEIRWFYKNFSQINLSRVGHTRSININQSTIALAPAEEAPTCGSYWNQVKLIGCTSLCGATTAGLAAGLCGWGCWCTFCTKNSSVAKAICAD